MIPQSIYTNTNNIITNKAFYVYKCSSYNVNDVDNNQPEALGKQGLKQTPMSVKSQKCTVSTYKVIMITQ